MSLSQGLNSAASGLTAAARSAEIVAENLANLRTPGFARRELAMTTSRHSGVVTGPVLRHDNPVLTGDRRLAGAAATAAAQQHKFYAALEGWIGLPGDSGTLSTGLDQFETALLAAAANPSSTASLAAVADAAQALVTTFNTISTQIQTARQQAEDQLRADIDYFNSALTKVAELNRAITRTAAQGQDISGLLDQRQTLVETVADIIPLREVQRENGQIVLYSATGVTLLDGRPAILSAQPAGHIAAESGPLPGPTLNGHPFALAKDRNDPSGRLAANFAIRDELAPQAQAMLDALARDLIDRTTGIDPTLGPGMPGLFTDFGEIADPAATMGLAGRMRVNDRIIPANGGDLWRLRAGIAAHDSGEPGDSRLLTAAAVAMSASRPAADPALGPISRDASGFINEFLSTIATTRLAAERQLVFSTARHTALEQQVIMTTGVDSDQELHLLLQVETAYAANARVIQTIDRMLATLLEI